jgi:hypothetical protein
MNQMIHLHQAEKNLIISHFIPTITRVCTLLGSNFNLFIEAIRPQRLKYLSISAFLTGLNKMRMTKEQSSHQPSLRCFQNISRLAGLFVEFNGVI